MEINELRVVRCPLAGLQDVEVVYSMMASEEEMESFAKSVGRDGAAAVVAEVRNWPAERFGAEPFGPKAPMAFRIWAASHGMRHAIEEYVGDPNFSMAWTPSTPPTPAVS